VRVSEERFALAARGANDGIWDWDLTTDEVMLSPRWKSMLGYDQDELTDTIATWDALLRPDDKDAVWESMSRHLAGDSDIYEGESWLRHKDGHYVPVLTRGFALRRGSDGAAQRFTGTITDLTEARSFFDNLAAAANEANPALPFLPPISWLAILFGIIWIACGIGMLTKRWLRVSAFTVGALYTVWTLGHVLPKYLALPDFVQAKVPIVDIGVLPGEGSGHFREPRYDHPEFQKAFRDLIELLAAEYDQNPLVEWIDLM